MFLRRGVIRILLAVGSVALASAEFRASAVKVDITPKSPQWLMGYGARQSTGVHDPIFHRIAAMDDGTTQVYLIASDLCLFSPSVYDDVTARVEAGDRNRAEAGLVDRHPHPFRAGSRASGYVRRAAQGPVGTCMEPRVCSTSSSPR